MFLGIYIDISLRGHMYSEFVPSERCICDTIYEMYGRKHVETCETS